jgi:cytochrome b561
MKIFKRFIIASMFFDFIVLAGTGIIRFPEIQKYFLFVYDYFSASTISLIHDWSGIFLVLLIITHLILKRQGLKDALTVGSRLSKRSIKIIYIIIGIILIIFIAIYFNTIFSNNKPIQLSSIEITEYQDEKLGSINDFRENSIKGPQYVDKNSYNLEIIGLVETATNYSYDDILKLPIYQKVVTLNCVEGWSVKALWEGC